ncbi:conserved unknown protein [Ectocarpus siliculosus]|uniref:Glycosyltransferase 61 catalytic domain-containing protein n=1 Tax=Ectocarpus siliculosus TaxID=2880 RepID=D8LIQ5_ECTSI|nr:conserved unknown protein [Ectocarpus siliculosus]|eukprot:CBN75965.1 conserved unknown protein [Ectocarpus siliculosus]
MPPALAEKSPIIGLRGGKEDETAAAAATIASGQDLPRPNRLRREGYPSSRGDRQRHQQLRTKQERIPYAPVSWNHHDQQEWGQEHRKLDRTTKGDPKLSLEPEILEDGNSTLIYRAATTPPTKGMCPVALHNSNAAVLREDRDNAAPSTVIAGALSVWKRLRQAATAPSRLRCPSPPCCLGMHAHTYQGGDLGEEMSHIQGAVVVRRPDLVRAPGSLAPAHDLDFVKTFQSYFQIAQSSLLRLLTPYCSGEDPRRDIEECVRIPTLVSMANVYTNKKGAVWNENVFVMTQEWTPNYYHFTVEHLPRITLGLDILLENPEIMISMHFYQRDPLHHDISAVQEVQMEMLEILGINRKRVVFVNTEMHAELAIVPTSTNCGDPDLQMVNMLRNRFLQISMHVGVVLVGMGWHCPLTKQNLSTSSATAALSSQGLFPTTNGVPPAPPRPVIVLVVRNKLRGLMNNEEVKEALERNFPSFDVVEFFGTGSVRDQLETFATAAMIIAPHGAGLANMMVAPLHTPVLEIGTLACPPCFLRLALKLHHIYARHPGGEWSQTCHAWYQPDVDEIVELASRAQGSSSLNGV